MYHTLKAFALVLSLAVACAQQSRRPILYANQTTSVAPERVYETDMYFPSNSTTIEYGEVYVDLVKPTRVSASQTTTYEVSLGSITNTEYIVSTNAAGPAGASTEPVDPSSSAELADPSSSAELADPSSSVDPTDPAASADPTGASPSSSDPTGVSTSAATSSPDAATPTRKVSASSAGSASSASTVLSPVTQLLSETTSTSTSILFSTTPGSSTATGTVITSLSSKSEKPLITVSMSTSTPSTSIATSTLTSAKTISTSNLLTALSSEAASSSSSNAAVSTGNATASFSVSSGTHTTTIVSAVTSLQGNTTVISHSSSTSVYTLVSSIEVLATESSTPISTSTSATATSTTSVAAAATAVDLFEPVATNEPPNVFSRNANPLDLASGVSNNGSPYETNKFFTNLMLDDQTQPAYVYPYTVWKYSTNSVYGFAVSHTTESQYVFGNYDSNGNSEYLVNPVGIASLIFSATSFGSSNFNMFVGDMTLSSCDVTINDGDSSNILEIPLVQGMGFTTGIYHGSLVPEIQTSEAFSVFEQLDSDNLAQGILKYRVTLNDNVQWLVYAILPNGYSTDSFELTMSDTSTIVGSQAIDGLILQFAAAPSESSYEVFYDEAAGMYATNFSLSGTSDGTTASYAFEYQTQGMSASGNTMLFALPHHVGAFTSDTQAAMTGIELQSTTKGTMQGLLTTSIQFTETLNTQIGWLPWTSQLGDASLSFSADLLQEISEAANAELEVDIKSSISGLNTYYIGKVLDKYAYILLTVAEIVQDSAVANTTLANMKDAFELLFTNVQLYPLYYDTKYGGVVSSGDWASTSTGYDFGNTYYNDHHFHYGYIVHAAAVVGYVDAQLGGTWAQDNRAWVDALVRDVANPSDSDSYFPVSRMFDWFQGHSWAAGLFSNANGKNEESSSEDYNFAYGMKMWGAVVGDSSMERRADLMIAIMARSMNDYFLYSDDNTVEPSEILGNRVSGILFDNEIDYTTYFGTEVQYINGIHMLPITPASSAVRGPQFVSEEWSAKLESVVGTLTDGWRGILTLNQALFDPLAAYEFFSGSSYSSGYLDDGMSLTWSLAFSGGLACSLGQL